MPSKCSLIHIVIHLAPILNLTLSQLWLIFGLACVWTRFHFLHSPTPKILFVLWEDKTAINKYWKLINRQQMLWRLLKNVLVTFPEKLIRVLHQRTWTSISFSNSCICIRHIFLLRLSLWNVSLIMLHFVLAFILGFVWIIQL